MIKLFKFKYLPLVKFDYINYKNEKSNRIVQMIQIEFGSTAYHKEPQFILRAYDKEKQTERSFAMKDITNFEYLI